MKTLKIVLIVLMVLGGLIYFAIWYSFRTTSEDISHLKPFSDIVGKELITVQPCRIAANYEPWVKENDYVIAIDYFYISGKATQLQELPLGSILKIKKAKRFTAGFSLSKSTYVLGIAYLPSLQKEVEFEFAWGTERFNQRRDLSGEYFVYHLAPWQEKPLEVMYNYQDNLEVPIEKNLNQSNVLGE